MFNSISSLHELFTCHVFPFLIFEDWASSGQTVLYLPLEDVSNIGTDKPVLVAIVEGAQVMAGLVLLTMYKWIKCALVISQDLGASQLIRTAGVPQVPPPPVVIIILHPGDIHFLVTSFNRACSPPKAVLGSAVGSSSEAHVPPDVTNFVLWTIISAGSRL